MIVCLLVSVVSCGKKPNDEKPKVTENATSQNTEAPEKETPKQAEETEKPAIDLNYYLHINAFIEGSYHGFYVDYCTKRYRDSAEVWSRVLHASGINFIVVQYYQEDFPGSTGPFTGTFTDVFDFLNNGHAFSGIQGYTFGKTFDPDIKIVPSVREITKINGIDAERIEGTAGENAENYVYGYTFICDKVPCMLIGIIVDQDEHQDLKTEIKGEIDLMAQTVRLNRKNSNESKPV